MRYLLIVTNYIVCLLFISQSLFAQSQPIEVGVVKWQRDFDAALKLSAKEGKPVFALFQEVPGKGDLLSVLLYLFRNFLNQ